MWLMRHTWGTIIHGLSSYTETAKMVVILNLNSWAPRREAITTVFKVFGMTWPIRGGQSTPKPMQLITVPKFLQIKIEVKVMFVFVGLNCFNVCWFVLIYVRFCQLLANWMSQRKVGTEKPGQCPTLCWMSPLVLLHAQCIALIHGPPFKVSSE